MYDGDYAAGFEDGVEILEELIGEEVDGFGAASEDVVDYIVELLACLSDGACIGHGVLNDFRVACR